MCICVFVHVWMRDKGSVKACMQERVRDKLSVRIFLCMEMSCCVCFCSWACVCVCRASSWTWTVTAFWKTVSWRRGGNCWNSSPATNQVAHRQAAHLLLMFILTYWPSEFINPQITASQPSPLLHTRLFTSTLSASGWIELWDKAASGMWVDPIVWCSVWRELELRTAGAKVKGHLLDPLSHPPLSQTYFLFLNLSFFRFFSLWLFPWSVWQNVAQMYKSTKLTSLSAG